MDAMQISAVIKQLEEIDDEELIAVRAHLLKAIMEKLENVVVYLVEQEKNMRDIRQYLKLLKSKDSDDSRNLKHPKPVTIH